MGRHANARAWAEFERIDRQRQEAYFGEDAPLTPEEIARIEADELERLDMDRLDAVRRYGKQVCRVELWDEVRAGL
jgi:non-ribosomal peptide synthetase component F